VLHDHEVGVEGVRAVRVEVALEQHGLTLLEHLGRIADVLHGNGHPVESDLERDALAGADDRAGHDRALQPEPLGADRVVLGDRLVGVAVEGGGAAEGLDDDESTDTDDDNEERERGEVRPTTTTRRHGRRGSVATFGLRTGAGRQLHRRFSGGTRRLSRRPRRTVTSAYAAIAPKTMSHAAAT
jgi:hypothetical protein